MTIKRQPSDFQVTEVLSQELLATLRSEPGPVALYRLSKDGLSTPEAVGFVNRTLRLPSRALVYAGLKDKHASSLQHLSLTLDENLKEAPERAEGPGWQLERLGWVDRPIQARDIAANGFQIVVRALTEEACRDMDQAIGLLSLPQDPASGQRSLRVVNYFGDQRFGSARHGHGFLAKHLIRGEFEEALKLALAVPARKDHRSVKEFKRAVEIGWGNWKELLPRLRRCPERAVIERLARSPKDLRGAFCELPYFFRQLCIYAYQSWLWNSIARRLVAERCAEPGPVLSAEDPFGEMLFPAAACVPEDLAELDLPLLGYKTELKEPWTAAATAVLTEEGITTAQLRIPRVRRPFFGEEPRRLFVLASKFVASPEEPDGQGRFVRTVAFELPRGAYATVVLRALGQ
jgi:tRNA pseudouridine13 synthase